jgi:RND family efflux transporter MFP subunit
MKKSVIVLVVLLLVGLLGWRVYQKITAAQPGSSRPANPATAVATQPVHRETLRDVRTFTGSVLPREQFVLAPKVAGRLEKLLVNISDPVRNGDLVARLENQEYLQQVEQARAELDVARANVAEAASARDVAAREFERVKELLKQKVASEAEMEQAQARFLAAQARHDVALAQVKQNEAALKASEVRLSYTQIHATWEGNAEPRVVGERFVDEGAMLKANEPIVTILDCHTVIAVISVIERDYPLIRTGQTAVATTDAFPGAAFDGAVSRKAPLLKESSRQARVEVEVANPERRLAPGMFVRVEIPFAVKEKAIVVPAAAVVRREGKTGVFQPDPDGRHARFVPVTPGIVSGSDTEITAPALEGQVIVLGQHLLDDGSAILLPGQERPKGDPRP